jgi:hypothetical protein
MDHTRGESPTNKDGPQKPSLTIDIQKDHDVVLGDDGVRSDLVEIGACSTLSGLVGGGGGGFLSRNASPYSSMRDIQNQPTTAAVVDGVASPSIQEPPPTTTTSNNNKKQRKRENDNYDNNNNNNTNASSSVMTSSYGTPILVTTSGNFPAIGSTLGPYFCVGRLGKGTFCSIHKCINLHYFHDDNNNNKKKKEKIPRLAAAKVEIGEFINSGILGSEASILHFLHSVLPDHTVPMYMGHYQASVVNDDTKDVTSAIVMEYLVRRFCFCFEACRTLLCSFLTFFMFILDIFNSLDKTCM